MQRRDERAQVSSTTTSPAVPGRGAPPVALWAAIATERRAAVERTTPGAARCGWVPDRNG